MMPSDIQSLSVNTGIEYLLIERVMFRGGYHYGNKKKGDSNYATASLGVNYYGAHLDFAWLFAEKESTLRNSFWISLGFSF
ncbi:MAG: hypothetical protein LIO65_10400 [Odoribacter sp.]|nr:hypothetical protein [Odoribacter sp.]